MKFIIYLWSDYENFTYRIYRVYKPWKNYLLFINDYVLNADSAYMRTSTSLSFEQQICSLNQWLD